MNMPRLLRILAALLVFLPAALASVQEPSLNEESGLRRAWCSEWHPGCFSLIANIRLEPQGVHPSLEELLKRPVSPEDSLMFASVQDERRPLETPKLTLRTRREERKVASGRRRGGKQLGTRSVCRGCFSGLMLTGRPAEGGAEQTLPNSLSESGENSSGGD
ncbi:uncharacterized protein LOC143820942 [Paroedura picta]|uniref:uncharacterized protein LOC143820942 n=1 Tax=Paroedura picta TaxID=143630 RepID=UPI004057A88D